MDKKSFILHLDSLNILDEMSLEQKGILFDAIYKYQLGIEVELDFSMKMAFAPFKNQFIRDNEKYTEFTDRQRVNGSKGGRPKNPKNPSLISETQKTLNDSGSVNESENVNESGSGSIVQNPNHFPPPPPLSEFISFAKLNKPNIDTSNNSKLVNRYNTYQASNWIDKDGNSIAEYWKAKVMAFLPHIDNQPENNGYKRRTNLAKYINSEK